TESFESILSEARKYRLNLIVANQFMTQLTDKIREALLGNVGTIICGRVGVTDADLMAKAFTPTFTAEDLTKTPNRSAVAKVMMFGMPSSPFTMKLPDISLMGRPNDNLLDALKIYSATKYAKTRAEVEREINARWAASENANNSEIPSDASSGPQGASGSETAYDTTSGQTVASTASQQAQKGFLDDWFASHPPITRDAPQAPQNAPDANSTSADRSEAIFRIR
ncbi:hypothetical protein IJF85_01310, partial [Candidatus Saccharibacteria bacterium]|nr:hypothetical protein [Candidatus Saccharibacteria bacterium]